MIYKVKNMTALTNSSNFQILKKIMTLYKGKGKGRPRTGHEFPRGGVDVYLYSSFNLRARCGAGSVVSATPRPNYIPPQGGKTRYPLYRSLGGPPGAGVDECGKNLATATPHSDSITGPTSP
jgi:hypothetical protein